MPPGVCRATTVSVHAISSIKVLINRMLKQGADIIKMKNCIAKTFNRHQINQKYGIQGNGFVNQLFN